METFQSFRYTCTRIHVCVTFRRKTRARRTPPYTEISRTPQTRKVTSESTNEVVSFEAIEGVMLEFECLPRKWR